MAKALTFREMIPRRAVVVAGDLGPLIALEVDLSPHPSSRLRAKLLVFSTVATLRAYWRLVGRGDLGTGCRGAVAPLQESFRSFSRDGALGAAGERVDPTYFALIGLVKRHLTAEIIAHEAVHLGFAYERRVRRNTWGKRAADFDEERIAYPAGRMAAAINDALHSEGLLP